MAAATSVIPLLSNWELYITAHPEGDLPGFAHWLLAIQPANPEPVRTSLIPLLLTRLHRNLQLLSKPIAKELGFTKPLEFELLVQVAILQNPNKKELSQELLIESSTGVEITKRLIQRGFLVEKPDPADRRSACLSLTEKGKKTLLKGYARLETIHSRFLDALPPEQQHQLAALLSQLNTWQTTQISPD